MSNDKKGAVELDDEQIAELREIFRNFDRNNDGKLTQLELGSLLRSLGLKPSEDQLEALIQAADKNSNGMIEFSEFIALVAPDLIPAKCPYTEEQLRQLFKMFDRDGNGYITPAELAHSMAKLGHALTAEELTGMIREADTDGDGSVTMPQEHDFVMISHVVVRYGNGSRPMTSIYQAIWASRDGAMVQPYMARHGD
ncbi:hypothetical protein Cgig2_023364 [Carnegiea gigantea]|uniref:EF-hand domain-containing protein n=1 Tax=Carnegiea gigantea TaxID=171969 RepID=A0A9Q1GSA2_9CARY|nr:hypothetical protein Cgig2_023364 [Carnegiea gigantea]